MPREVEESGFGDKAMGLVGITKGVNIDREEKLED